MTVLEKTLRSIALVDPQYKPWVDSPTSSDLAKTETVDQSRTDFPSAHLRLWIARALIQEHRFDEAQKLLDGLEPEQVVDPATLWFSQAIVSHQLLKKDACLEAIESLLADTTECPRRYRALAERMRNEMKNLKVDDLDHIARRMNEIRRRLELGQTDPKVRQIEDGVIESLDKMIENLEQQQKQQQQASASASQSLRSSRPAEESVPAGGKGPGRVTQKTFDGKSDWGNLPPKERKKTLQQIGREFPSHYQEIIEQYFRRQATEEETRSFKKMPLKRLSLIPTLFLIAILSPAIISPRSLCAETIQFQVDLLDGRNVVGELIASEKPVPSKEKTVLLKLKTNGGTESWPIDQVLRVTRTESASIGSPPTKKPSKTVWVELVDGSRVQVDNLSVTDTGARLDRRPAPLEIPVRDLHAVRFREASGSILNQWRGLTTKPSDNGDRLVVLKSDALSVHHGSLGPIDAARVELTVGDRTLRVRREKVFGLIYAHPAGRPLAGNGLSADRDQRFYLVGRLVDNRQGENQIDPSLRSNRHVAVGIDPNDRLFPGKKSSTSVTWNRLRSAGNRISPTPIRKPTKAPPPGSLRNETTRSWVARSASRAKLLKKGFPSTVGPN